jgi:glyoxylate/hydroxypyruvate reductase A
MHVLLMPPRDHERWHDALTIRLGRALPGTRVHLWPEVGPDPAAIEVAMVWTAPPELFEKLPRLRCVMALGAGVDDLAPVLPPHIALTRVVDAALTASMTEYVLYHVLRYHRSMDAYRADRELRAWHPRPYPPAAERSIGVLGLGALGTHVARTLAGLGFRVYGLSRAPKHIADVTCVTGEGALDTVLAHSQILVCLLPLTDETRDLLGAHAFARMPRGACLINAARGAVVVDEELLAALDMDHLSGATLDVFRQEPLPPAHPFWRHPRVTVTPHIASLTNLESVAAQLTDNVCRFAAGKPLAHAVERGRGY